MKNKLLNITFATSMAWQLLLYLRFPGFIWEDCFMIPWFISKDLKYYQDFNGGSYFPLLKLVMIPINSFFNWNPKGTIILGFILILLTNYLIYFISKKYLAKYYQIIPLIFFNIWSGFILQQNTFEINLFLGSLILLNIHFLITWSKTSNSKYVFLMGLISSVAIFSQQMTIASMGTLFLITLVLTIKNKVNIFKFLILYSLGFILIPIYMFYWFYSKGLINDFYYWNILYYFQNGGYPFNRYFSLKDITMLMVINIPFIVQTFRLIIKRKITLFDMCFWTAVALSITLTLLAVLHPRRYLYFLPLLSILAGYEFQYTNKIIKYIALTILTIYLVFVIAPVYTKMITKGRQHEIQNIHHPGDKAYEAIMWIRENSKPEDRVFSFETMIAYYEMQRLPAINRTYILPWAFEPFDQTKIDIEKSNARYWLVSELMFGRFTQLGYKHQADYIRSYLDKNYVKIICFDWACVYEKKSR